VIDASYTTVPGLFRAGLYRERFMTVWILFHETNTGRSDPSDGYVEAVYAAKETANAARLAAIRKARDEGKAIWMDPDDPDEAGSDDWTNDWSVEAHEVIA
jgi:hypothetical protein